MPKKFVQKVRFVLYMLQVAVFCLECGRTAGLVFMWLGLGCPVGSPELSQVLVILCPQGNLWVLTSGLPWMFLAEPMPWLVLIIDQNQAFDQMSRP